VGLVFGTIGFLVGILIIPFWMFYLLKDKTKGMRLFYSLLTPRLRDDARRLISIIADGLNNYIRGQLLVAGSVGVLATIGLMLIGFKPNTAIFLGFLAGLFEVLPIVGPILGAIPSLLVAFFYDGQVANMEVVLRVVITFIIVQQIEGNLLVPKIAGDSTKLHPAIVMLVIIIGSEVGGLVGAIIAVPLTAVGRDVYIYLYQRLVLAATPEQAEAKVPSKRDEIAAKIYRQEQRRLKRRTEAEALLEKQKQAETTTALAKKGEL
jgi:predicted PurR-regulated permease PerM